MLGRMIRSFGSDQGAAIAPLYALALFGLIGMAGVGFDYARLMTMDSELQNAADHAALAAATQLDGREGAMARARDAANDFFASETSDYTNETLLSNDGDGRRITSLSFNFYDSYDSATDTFGNEITDDDDGEDAAVVMVTVNGREVFYALTPIVGAVSSGDITADAVAGLQTATCNVPPLMFCAPNDTFPAATDVGKGMLLHMKANQADVWSPGNFGFLNIDYVYPESGNPNNTLGRNADLLGCVGEHVESRTGSRTPEMKALNTRFDMNVNPAPDCNASTGSFCPAENVRRNWVNVQTRNNVDPGAVDGLTCNASPSGTWEKISDLSGASNPPPAQGLPRDTAFGTGNYTNFGSGAWPSATYLNYHHGIGSLPSAADLDGNGSISRYETYRWEINNSMMTAKKVGYNAVPQGGSGKYKVDLYCSYPQPTEGTPVVPSGTQKDRRLMTVASVDCTGLNGHAEVTIIKWVDLFMVEPSNLDGSDQNFFAEVKGPAEKPGGGSAFQYYGRNKPVLLR